MKKIVAFILTVILCLGFSFICFAENETKTEAEITDFLFDNKVDLELNVNGAYLIEASSGAVLYSYQPFTEASPASVTKIMTLLLVCEALEEGCFKLTDNVSISDYAASMGGSQVFLEEGERMTVEELIKCTVIASANDAAVALAELVSGSEGAFVKKMNAKAIELGLKNTSFENTTGLDDTTEKHFSCPRDIAIMSRELIKHDIILKYSGIWQDTIRNGEFTLTNTNRLVRYYDGCNGLKTGSTDKAGYCVSATAKRGEMQLIAVVMGAQNREARNEAARKLLDYGFANYTLYEKGEEYLEDCQVLSGTLDKIGLYTSPVSFVISKDDLSTIEVKYDIPEKLVAPLNKGSVVGKVTYLSNNKTVFEGDIYVIENVEAMGLFTIYFKILRYILAG